MTQEQLQRLRIASEQKRRPRFALWLTFLLVAAATGTAIYFAVPRASDKIRSGLKSGREAATEKANLELANRSTVSNPKPAATATVTAADAPSSSGSAALSRPVSSAAPGSRSAPALIASGYIVARERIEISPRFMGVVNWIGVKKGDTVTNGQVVVRLDDSEYRARLAEIEGQLSVAQVAVEKTEIDYRRAKELVASNVEMKKYLDDARLALATASAQIKQMEGARQLIRTWLDWCTIRSPVNGVVLEKLADASELVTPQNFGGGRGPSTSLLAVADLHDLQVEVDLSESDLAKVALGQKCRVSPEAYPDKFYEGVVAEIAPEASRQKGTLQVKVQVLEPDRFLTPELSAKIEFL